MSGKWSAPGGGNKVPQKKVKLDEDDEDDDEDDEEEDFDDEETEEKVPVKKSVPDTPAKNAQKPNHQLKTFNTKIKGSRVLQKTRKKLPKHQKDLVL
jgi:nucleophosmin 1